MCHVDKLCKIFLSKLAQNRQSQLESLLKEALMGNRDSWLIFLDLLEEEMPEVRKKLNGLSNDLFLTTRLRILSEHFSCLSFGAKTQIFFNCPNIVNFIEYYDKPTGEVVQYSDGDRVQIGFENMNVVSFNTEFLNVPDYGTISRIRKDRSAIIVSFIDNLYRAPNMLMPGDDNYDLFDKLFQIYIDDTKSDINKLKEMLRMPK